MAGPDVEGGTAPDRVRDAIATAKAASCGFGDTLMRARTARMSDAAAVHRLIAHYAGEGLLLPRTEAEIREHIARFLVLVEKHGKEDKVLGCVALEPYGARPRRNSFARRSSRCSRPGPQRRRSPDEGGDGYGAPPQDRAPVCGDAPAGIFLALRIHVPARGRWCRKKSSAIASRARRSAIAT